MGIEPKARGSLKVLAAPSKYCNPFQGRPIKTNDGAGFRVRLRNAGYFIVCWIFSHAIRRLCIQQKTHR